MKITISQYLVSVVIDRLTGEVPDVERKSLTIAVDWPVADIDSIGDGGGTILRCRTVVGTR